MSFFEELKMRKKLVKAMRLIDVEPRIYYASESKLVFAIPHGVNPSKLHDSMYVFRQVFGRDVELVGDLKRFDLTIPTQPLPDKVMYNFEDWNEIKGALPIVCGIDTLGKRVYYDISEQPHLLVSGETGSGKSSLLRTILTTLILSKNPENIRLVLGDLKRSEFGLFRNLPHVDAVCVDAVALNYELKAIESEMKRRGDLLDRNHVTHISELKEPLPYYIVAIDEVALLRKERHVMDSIEDISSVGRSLGILLILSMQRPDSKVLEGRLKNNLTVRISGRQSNLINANVAGVPGAELIKQSQRGRMIISLDGDYKRIQVPWLSDSDARKLLEPLRLIDDDKTFNTHDIPLFGVLNDE